MTNSVHQPHGTTAEVGTRTHVLRSVAVLAPLLAAVAFGTVLVAEADSSAPPSALPAASTLPVEAPATLPTTLPTTGPAPETTSPVDAPTLVGASVVTAGEPISVEIPAPAGLQLARPATNGLVQLEAPGRATYVPVVGFVGSDTFSVQSCNSGGCGHADVTVEVLPATTSTFVETTVERLVDTRSGEVLSAGSTVAAPLTADADYEAVALSVTVMASQTAGEVEVDGGSGPVAALAVSGAGQMTTNLVIVPASGDVPLELTTSAGGHLVVDLVGYFESSTGSAGGRFVQVDPVPAANLVTAVDGRAATVETTELDGLPHGEVGAVLALVTADVGPDGGRVELGPGVADYDQMLAWGAPTGPNLQRRGVVLVTPDADGAFSFDYQGGAEIDVQILGYFTSPAAATTRAGLYVPADVSPVLQRDFTVGTNVVGEVPEYAGAAFVTLTAEPGVTGASDPRDLGIASGRTIGTTLAVGPAPNGSGQGVVVSSATDLRAEFQVLGVFLAGATP